MTSMKAAIYTGIGEIEVRQVERSRPAPGQVLLDTRCTGICGSDLHSYNGTWQQSHTKAAGHETCGVVAELGDGVTGFAIGDPVAVECFSHCGSCRYCTTGQYNHCLRRQGVSPNTHGGFAEFTAVHASALFKLPAGMSYEEGALVEPLAVSWRALAQAAAGSRDRVAIIGGGTIGQFALAAARAVGVRETLITVKYGQQARLAADLGADHVVDVGSQDLGEYVSDLTDGVGMDLVIETVGAAGCLRDALTAVRPRGRVVLVSGHYDTADLDLTRIVWSEAVVTGSNCYGYSGMETDFDAAIDLIASGRVAAGKLVSHRLPFDDIAEAFRISADKNRGAIKVHVFQE